MDKTGRFGSEDGATDYSASPREHKISGLRLFLMRILTVNSGSSSLKFALYQCDASQLPFFSGSFSNIGTDRSYFLAYDQKGNIITKKSQSIKNHRDASIFLISWLKSQDASYDLVSHRIVQGGLEHRTPIKIDENLLSDLRKLLTLAPNHLPQEIALIEVFQEQNPSLDQIACFDTAFHKLRPSHRQKYALPRHFATKGIIRYGFHGISYEYIVNKMRQLFPEDAEGKVIACHLGHGASIAAIEKGICQDTTMGFTPVSGLVMSSRTGELDPEVILYLQKEYGLTIDEAHDLIHHQSGILGLSELSSEMEELLKVENENPKAKEAILIFCESVVKHIGSLAALLGGVQTLIFTGGIGENAATIRSRICHALFYLGLTIDQENNRENARVISDGSSKVNVYVIPTNEEEILMQHALKLQEGKVN